MLIKKVKQKALEEIRKEIIHSGLLEISQRTPFDRAREDLPIIENLWLENHRQSRNIYTF
ncbi:hypothetical protein [Bacteroidetes bacterium endosymbiont of Geopemphigus sp.]|uniref:hypothetical protein n=1 Tax=Bacteroidetes bacterium endosymbiont of Geopemphigus sp. TaxID=2047937 RepID=UPI000CD1A095|nr:hypothetical protein [Bacteroidetes bacterium endosymbiont of Geopemphigus sp.]